MKADSPIRSALDSPGCRVLIVGSGSYAPGARLPDVPSVARTVADLATTLQERCGISPANLVTVVDPANPIEFGRVLTEAAAQATDVLLVYYVGHGLVSPGNELYLATAATDDPISGLAFKALAYHAVSDVLGASPARFIVVVLDCCFAGRAKGSVNNAPSDAFALASLGGSYLLAAASAHEEALAPPGEPHTAFTGTLIKLLVDGDPNELPGITVDGIYRHLRRELPRRGFPAPLRHVSANAGELVVAANPAASTQTERDRPDRRPGQLTEQPCPYRGLDSYTAEDTRLYFGREKTLADLMIAVGQYVAQGDGLVVVTGVSGVGKSSLLHAGLLPAISHGQLRLPGSPSWPQLALTPGEQPLATLAARLAQAADQTSAEILTALEDDPSAFVSIVRGCLLRRAEGREIEGARLVVVVDQFEELFTSCREENVRISFVRALAAGAHEVALVVLGVRADFYARCLVYPELLDALKHRQFPIGPMSRDQLRDAIVKPAHISGLSLETGLAQRLLDDVGDGTESSAGNLPLMSYALQQTWTRREASMLTLAGYVATGGVHEAVTRQADRVYDGLDSAGRHAVRALLLRMVHISTDAEDTRRAVNLTELLADRRDDAEAIGSARDALAAGRLITLDDDIARIAHDALLRAWPRLRRWIDEDRQDLLIEQKLLDDAEEWRRNGRDRSGLYRGAKLAAARDWFRDPEHRAALSPTAQRFLHSSLAARRRNVSTAIGGVILLVLAVASGGFAFNQYRNATEQKAVLNSDKIAQTADAIRTSDPAAAQQLSLAAYRLAETPQARASLISSALMPFPVDLVGHRGDILSLSLTSDTHILASTSNDKTVRLWDLTDPHRPVAAAIIKLDGSSSSVADFVPGTRILVAQTSKTLILWDTTKPTKPVELSHIDFDGSNPTEDLTISPDGRTVAASGIGGTLRLWDITDPHNPRAAATLDLGPLDLQAVAFDTSRPVLATGRQASDGPQHDLAAVTLWNIEDIRHPKALSTVPVEDVWGLAFDPDEDFLIATGLRHTMRVWDVSDTSRPVVACPGSGGIQDNKGMLRQVVFAQDAGMFVTADGDGAINRWRLDDFQHCPMPLPDLPESRDIFSATVSGDAQVSISGSHDGVIRVWTDPSPPLPHAALPQLQTGFSPDGKIFAANAYWDVTDPHHPLGPSVLPGPQFIEGFIPGTRTATATDAGFDTLSLWDASNPDKWSPESTIQGPGTVDARLGSTTSPDHRLMAVNRANEVAIDIWDISNVHNPRWLSSISNLVSLWRWGPAGLTPTNFVFSQFIDNRTLFINDGNGIEVFDLRDPAHPATLASIKDTDLSRPASLSGTLVAMAPTPGRNYQEAFTVYNLSDPRHPKKLNADSSARTARTVKFVGRELLAIATRTSIELVNYHDPAKPVTVAILPADDEVSNMFLSPDGRTLAVADNDGPIRLWDLSTPDSPITYGYIPQKVSSTVVVDFSADSTLMAFFDDGGAHLVDLDPHRVAKYLCSINPRPISTETWQHYVPGIPYLQPCD